jgi:uncharacterized RDD family membrane protein YckC
MLFDLPLVAEPELANKPRHTVREPEPAPTPEPEPVAEQIALPQDEHLLDEAPPEEVEEIDPRADLLRRRVTAGAVDLGLLLGGLALVLAGAAALGARPSLATSPAYAVLGVVLSFLYSAFSLLFWGRTPGMVQAGLSASSHDGTPMTIAQTLLRWAGGVCTVMLLGLPMLLALNGGRTLSDRISGSQIVLLETAAN